MKQPQFIPTLRAFVEFYGSQKLAAYHLGISQSRISAVLAGYAAPGSLLLTTLKYEYARLIAAHLAQAQPAMTRAQRQEVEG